MPLGMQLIHRVFNTSVLYLTAQIILLFVFYRHLTPLESLFIIGTSCFILTLIRRNRVLEIPICWYFRSFNVK